MKLIAALLFIVSFSVLSDDLIVPGKGGGYYSNGKYYQRDSAGGVYTPDGRYETNYGNDYEYTNKGNYQQRDSAGGIYSGGKYHSSFGEGYYSE